MKYHTLGSSNISGETKTSGFTLYADMGLSENKISFTETDMKKVREELEHVQRNLKLQTKRCRHLVAEYTRKLQEKERLFENEKSLRDTQLAKVLKALLIFEARLRQEQKFISHQLSEKDYIINTQKNDIKKILANQYCKNCNQYYTMSSSAFASFHSSSEYIPTEPDYQSSNLESLDSSSETYAVSEREFPRSESETHENIYTKNIFQKNKYSQGRRKVAHRKSIGTYFEVLKIRNDSPLSNEDNTSGDYDNLDSLPPESVSDKLSVVSENIGNMLNNSRSLGSTTSESSITISSSDECDKTVINTTLTKSDEVVDSGMTQIIKHTDLDAIPEKAVVVKEPENKLTETIPVFEGGGDSNDNWYASASDQEDEDHRDVYRNNPVLECMNQILLQNINDINSPPKTPNIERKNNKNNKRVKFIDEEEKEVSEENINKNGSHDYYETPIQKIPNFYETPQSIYSNDYEQILSKSSVTSSESSKSEIISRKTVNSKDSHHYIEMEKSQDQLCTNNATRKNKILRVPPALPPKPPNLVSKCKIHTLSKKPPSDYNSSCDLEPDYCSISELNLPQNKVVSIKTINVIAEVHSPTSNDIKNRINNIPMPPEKLLKKPEEVHVATTPPKEEISNLVVKKNVEKLNNQLAKHSLVKSESVIIAQSPRKKIDVEIPKLPQVSEIIIPDDPDENEEEIISQDNYVKNNTQISQEKNIREPRKPVIIGSSVSSLISGFNNNKILNDIKKKHERIKPETKNLFSSFENLQNMDKHFTKSSDKLSETPSFENFDLSQNFEEFKLDDCEIEEYDVEEELEREEKLNKEKEINPVKIVDVKDKNTLHSDNNIYSKRVDYIRAKDITSDITLPHLNQSSLDILMKQLEIQGKKYPTEEGTVNETKKDSNQPTYEHFLECTGLSSKSILTPAGILTNHTHMLKPKDVKIRSKLKVNTNIFEKRSGSTVKYWSEPFV